MNKFAIGEQCGDKGMTQDERNATYGLLRQEIQDKLGVEDGYLCGFPPYDVLELDGEFYLRSRDYSGKYYTALCEWNDSIKRAKGGVVLCPCGSKTFHIDYGGYECIAICTKCSVKHVVYDG